MEELEEQLYHAIERGDLLDVNRLLRQPGINVNKHVSPTGITEDGIVPLQYAASKGELEIVEALLRVPSIDVDLVNGWSPPPLYLACLCLLVEDDRNYFHYVEDDNSQRRCLQIVRALLEAGADPNAPVDVAYTDPIIFGAVDEGCPASVLEALLNGGADPTVRLEDGSTTLHEAVLNENLRAVQLLIQRCAKDNLYLDIDEEGRTPLDILQNYQNSTPTRNQVAICRLFLQCYTKEISERDGPNCLHTILQEASRRAQVNDNGDPVYPLEVGKLDSCKFQILLECLVAEQPASVVTSDSDGLLPLQVACQLDFPAAMVNVLLRHDPSTLLQLRHV